MTYRYLQRLPIYVFQPYFSILFTILCASGIYIFFHELDPLKPITTKVVVFTIILTFFYAILYSLVGHIGKRCTLHYEKGKALVKFEDGTSLSFIISSVTKISIRWTHFFLATIPYYSGLLKVQMKNGTHFYFTADWNGGSVTHILDALAISGFPCKELSQKVEKKIKKERMFLWVIFFGVQAIAIATLFFD